jgi:hypothetical protein
MQHVDLRYTCFWISITFFRNCLTLYRMSMIPTTLTFSTIPINPIIMFAEFFRLALMNFIGIVQKVRVVGVMDMRYKVKQFRQKVILI